MAKKRTELEARLLEEHGRVISVVQRWQSEQQAVDEVRASLAEAEARLNEAVLEGALSLIHILRAHETVLDLVCRLLLDKKKTNSAHTRPYSLPYSGFSFQMSKIVSMLATYAQVCSIS